MSVSYLPVRIMALVSIVSVPINVIVKLVGRIRTVSKVFKCFTSLFVLYTCIKIFKSSKCHCIVHILNNDFFFVDRNECLDLPCHNNGTCINNNGSYTCSCENGWESHDCEKGKPGF